jgi:hypothetical protein
VNGTHEAERSYAGIKVQIKGPVSGKSGMKASKKVWSWGTTGGADFSMPVDFARRQALTKAGLVGIKVRGRTGGACGVGAARDGLVGRWVRVWGVIQEGHQPGEASPAAQDLPTIQPTPHTA